MPHPSFRSVLRVLLLLLALGAARLEADDVITLAVYNVENLFDADGVAQFDQYGALFPGDDPDYDGGMLLRKLDAIAKVLSSVNDGAGPDVIAFQEFETDQTPESTVDEYEAFLDKHRSVTVAQMLAEPIAAEFKGLPVTPLLLKRLEEAGLGRYHVALGGMTIPEGGRTIAHQNAVFSRLPILATESHPLESARDLLEVTLDAGGQPLTILNNHWKSGASDPRTEGIRVANAAAVRARLDEILAKNPATDVLIVGDFNSYYNQKDVVRDAPITGIDRVLGSQGDELALTTPGGPDLYNLWYDVAPEERFSEVWRGRKSTLMQVLLTPGLYDGQGVQYVDNSLHRIQVTGVNVDDLGRPLHWDFAYGGGGASDHLPLVVELKVVGDRGRALRPTQPHAKKRNPIDWRPPAEGLRGAPIPLTAESTKSADAEWWRERIGRLVAFEATLRWDQPISLAIGPANFRLWGTSQSLQEHFQNVELGATVKGRGVLLATDNGLVIDVYSPDWLTITE